MEDNSTFFLILGSILRIVGATVCSTKAKELNRSTVGWAFFGFFSPILAMIWVYCMKPVIKWDENVDIEKKDDLQASTV